MTDRDQLREQMARVLLHVKGPFAMARIIRIDSDDLDRLTEWVIDLLEDNQRSMRERAAQMIENTRLGDPDMLYIARSIREVPVEVIVEGTAPPDARKERPA